MRTLSSSLLAVQQSDSHTPFLKVEIKNKMTGVNRLNWERLYQGTEDEYHHGVAFAGDGSLVRARISLPADGSKLYRQTIPNPGPLSGFSTWIYTGQYDCLAVTVASCSSEVSVFWINGSRELRMNTDGMTPARWDSSS